jgi:uncharacterized protein (TIGR00730 family)
MTPSSHLSDNRLADAWATLQAQDASAAQQPLTPDPQRLAFADAEFMLRRETRGVRLQLELLKPDIEQQAHGIESTVVVFGSARFKSPEAAQAALTQAEISGDAQALASAKLAVRNAHYYDQARVFGGMVARYSATKAASEKLFVCTGGGPGIMEAANRGAHEAGGLSVGLSIALPKEEHPNPYITPALTFKFHYFALRKMHFMMRAKALVAFPGGFGTLDELFETLTLIQCKKSQPVPIVLFGVDYWKRLLNVDFLVEEGVISAADLKLFQYTDDPAEAWKAITDFYRLG